jgi:hypothetical protein
VVQLDLTLGATKSQVTKGGRQLSLDVNFERRHDLISVFDENDVVPAYLRAARRRRLLLVGPASLPAPPAALGARLVERRGFGGLLPLEVSLYVPKDPARGFGVAGLERARAVQAERGARVREIRACLAGAGFRPHRAETSPPGSIALETATAGTERALLYVYVDRSRAARELPGIRGFLKASGGEARLAGQTVIGFTAPPSPALAERVERCA